jgi:hypothetical protein
MQFGAAGAVVLVFACDDGKPSGNFHGEADGSASGQQ